MPLSICARTMAGLTTGPQSTAQVTRLTCSVLPSATATSATCATIEPNEARSAMPRPDPAGSGCPSRPPSPPSPAPSDGAACRPAARGGTRTDPSSGPTPARRRSSRRRRRCANGRPSARSRPAPSRRGPRPRAGRTEKRRAGSRPRCLLACPATAGRSRAWETVGRRLRHLALGDARPASARRPMCRVRPASAPAPSADSSRGGCPARATTGPGPAAPAPPCAQVTAWRTRSTSARRPKPPPRKVVCTRDRRPAARRAVLAADQAHQGRRLVGHPDLDARLPPSAA